MGTDDWSDIPDSGSEEASGDGAEDEADNYRGRRAKQLQQQWQHRQLLGTGGASAVGNEGKVSDGRAPAAGVVEGGSGGGGDGWGGWLAKRRLWGTGGEARTAGVLTAADEEKQEEEEEEEVRRRWDERMAELGEGSREGDSLGTRTVWLADYVGDREGDWGMVEQRKEEEEGKEEGNVVVWSVQGLLGSWWRRGSASSGGGEETGAAGYDYGDTASAVGAGAKVKASSNWKTSGSAENAVAVSTKRRGLSEGKGKEGIAVAADAGAASGENDGNFVLEEFPAMVVPAVSVVTPGQTWGDIEWDRPKMSGSGHFKPSCKFLLNLQVSQCGCGCWCWCVFV